MRYLTIYKYIKVSGSTNKKSGTGMGAWGKTEFEKLRNGQWEGGKFNMKDYIKE